ncbi:MAG: cache domain-containing protein [Oceanospirillum sp.]|nr:cache domain-containing protein [Oceanospirillum sp.]
MKRTSISTRVWLILGLFASGMLANSYLESTNSRHAIQSCYEGNVQHVVEVAKSILSGYHQRQLSGELTESEAQALALEAISAIRYDGGNYIFMGDQHGVAISNGIKELVGTNILGMQDPTGLPLVRNLYEVAADGGGFVNYQWPDPQDKSTLLPKTSYADYFEPWQWTLGSGLNLESLRQEVKDIQNSSLVNLILVMITIGVIVIFFVHSVNLQIRKLVASMRELSSGHGNLSHRLSVDGGKEVAEISESYNQLASSLEEMAEQVRQDSQRFLAAVERMQPDVVIRRPAESDALTLDSVRLMINQICTQAEALEHSHASLKEMAEQDPTTGLLSQQAFEQRVRDQLAALDSNTPNTFALIGFDASDRNASVQPEQVGTVAGAMRHLLPDDVLACFMPDKGFAYWCSSTDSSDGMRLAMALQQQIDAELGEQQGVSFGVSSMLGGNKSYDLLISEAERALIRAQKEGGNRVYEY